MNDNVIPLRPRGTPPIPDFNFGPPPSKREQTMTAVNGKGEAGLTVTELIALTGWHHGSASAALSTLHRSGAVARLNEKRDGHAVYVAPLLVGDRPVKKPESHQQSMVDRMAEHLRRQHRDCKHDPDFPHPTCHRCDVRVLLGQYDRLRGSSH